MYTQQNRLHCPNGSVWLGSSDMTKKTNQRYRATGDAVDSIVKSIVSEARCHHLGPDRLPFRPAIHELVEELRTIMFPGFFGERDLKSDSIESHIKQIVNRVTTDVWDQVHAAICYWESITTSEHQDKNHSREHCTKRAFKITSTFISRLADVRRLLALDVVAAYEGDPAAEHTDETIFCYPGIFAIMVHRLAHELYTLNVPLLPRIMSEYAHAETGIDIHPGAHIGESFFIDHGTGVVIGETTIIGNHCKIYQGVTIGAKSFPKDERGRVIRGYQRHPTLGNRVTVYAAATILGGDTVIGDDCIINGGVFLTQSVPPKHVVQSAPPKLNVRTIEA